MAGCARPLPHADPLDRPRGGLLDWVALQIDRGEQWVFGELVAGKYGDRYRYLSRQSSNAIRAVGINDLANAFHSTRHNFKREGRRRRVSERDPDQMAGHTRSRSAGKYGQDSPIDALKEDIDRLEFRSVPWNAVVACARKRLLRQATWMPSVKNQ